MGTYSVSPRSASTCPLPARPCNASQVGMQTHNHESRVARNSRQEIGLSIRLSWLRTFQRHARGEGGRQ